jgi:hypothetical protein
MSKIFQFRYLLFIILISTINLFSNNFDLVYISPKPGSDNNYLDSKIILKFSDNIDNLKLNEKSIIVTGEKSGKHNGEFIRSDDGKTLIFKPFQQFLKSENVNITLLPDLFKDMNIKSKSYSFSTSASSIGFQPLAQRIDDDEIGKPFFQSKLSGDTLPSDLPAVNFPINDTNKAYKGNILISSSEPQGSRNYLMILDYKGEVIKWRKTNLFPFNFKLQPNGQFAYSESISGVATQAVARILDQDLNLVKSYQCGNGYKSFPSEFVLLPNGHILMVALDPMPVNMRNIIPNGDPNSNILGSVVQELDKDMNVVFQWRSWDYTEITETYENITLNSFRTLHLNGIDVDTDGHYLFSVRHFAQIMKINRNTGEIMWRLGGKKNEFKFINEHEENAPLYFSYQHEIRRQPNGNITFFDNGNLKAPQYSRAVEYKLDEEKKTATLVWEYRNNPDIYAATRGSVQFLPNGNYLIGCGSSSTAAKLSAVELIPGTNEIVMTYVLPPGFESYRTYKIDLPTCQPVANVIKEELMQGNTYNFKDAKSNTGISIEFSKIVTPISYNSFTITKYDCSPLNPEFEGNAPMILINKVIFEKTVMTEFTGLVSLDLKNYANNINLTEPKVFFRSTVDSGLFNELPTTYDNTSKKILFTIYGVGEICIGGYFDNVKPQIPILISPIQEAVLNKNSNIKFSWSPVGRYKYFTLTLGKKVQDKFELIQVIDSLKTTSYTYPVAGLNETDTYEWFVTAVNDFGSNISFSNNFQLKDSFINVLSPNGGEKFIKDSISYVIKWSDNLDNLVRIELINKDQTILKIADSLQSPLNNIKWTVPASVPPGVDYKIRISTIGANSMIALSEETFEIVDKATSVDDNYLRNLYKITISPNPVINTLNIGLTSEMNDNLEISIININGVELSSTEYTISTGINQLSMDLSSLNTGTYFLKIKSSKGLITEKFIKSE